MRGMPSKLALYAGQYSRPTAAPSMGLVTIDLFAGVPVSDYTAAAAWYERLLGAPPSFLPNDTEAVWELADHRYVFIEVRPEHAGHAMHIPLRQRLRRPHLPNCRARPGASRVRESYTNGVRKATFRNLIGNEIGLGGAPTRTETEP